ncbi:MAG: thioredoxin family protein [Thermoplasmatota archaeon]
MNKRKHTSLLISLILVSITIFLSGCVSENGDTRQSWLDTYTPVHSQGTGENNFWITYPEKLSKSGVEVNHPQWVLDELENNPILIVAGSDDCAPCIMQKRNINTVLETYEEQIQYFNIPTDGSDPRAWDAYNAYWSQDTSWYIPLTAIITKGRDTDNEVAIYWHSSTGSTGEQWISDFVKDAIYYHHVYKENS